MKKRVFVLGFWLWSAFAAYADLKVVELLEDLENDKPSGKEQIAFFVSGNRIRFDQGQSMSSIIRLDKKVTFSVMHEPRQYVVLRHDRIKPDSPPVSEMEEGGPDSFSVRSTGKVEKISGFSCRQVLIKEGNGDSTELWIAQDALDMKVFLSEFNRFMEFGLAQATRQIEKHPELRGVPIRVIEYHQGKMMRRAMISLLETNAIPDSVFEVPAGYGEIKMTDSGALMGNEGPATKQNP